MARDYTTLPLSQLRRKDRGIEDERWIKDLLHQTPFGVFAMTFNNQPLVNSNIFAYDEESHLIYFHTAREGKTRSTLEKDSRVCFSISEMGRFLPAKRALNFSVEYKGVTVFGRVRIVEESDQAKHALQLLSDKYFPHLKPEVDYETASPDELKRTTVYAIHIDEWSGKQKKVEDDFPGAFLYGQHPKPEPDNA